jgi:glucose-6-phosphate 1-dehydrogenase
MQMVNDVDATEARIGDPCAMVIFGATGDLTKRKLIPALYNLALEKLLTPQFVIIGVAIENLTTETFREKLSGEIREFATSEIDEKLWDWFKKRIYYVQGEFKDKNTYDRLKELTDKTAREHNTPGNIFFYLATSPVFFGEIVRQLGEAGLAKEEKNYWRRVVIEKPFGHDLESARDLNREIKEVLSEKQIYRIDHYLGKETVQNILMFRSGNGIFEPTWNRRYIDHVQITAAETVGVEGRGRYYEQAGALRDMVPNHLFQLLSLTAMEPPISFAANAVRDEQAKILNAVQPLDPEDVITSAVRGQYDDGDSDGKKLAGYREEPNVAPNSNVETFVALKLKIDNWRWADVPFYLRTGKRLPERVTEISIQFRRAPFILFRDTPIDKLNANKLIIHIQPDEGISFQFGAKVPGAVMKMGVVEMDFNYEDYFHIAPTTGYERLLHDCMIGDQTLFQRADMVEAGWNIIQPVLDVWKALPPRSFPNYAAGTWGPKDAEELLERDGRHWREIELPKK